MGAALAMAPLAMLVMCVLALALCMLLREGYAIAALCTGASFAVLLLDHFTSGRSWWRARWSEAASELGLRVGGQAAARRRGRR